jgi:hypothetical protein
MLIGLNELGKKWCNKSKKCSFIALLTNNSDALLYLWLSFFVRGIFARFESKNDRFLFSACSHLDAENTC